MKDDDVRCVILGRKGRTSSWDVITICLNKSSAWRSAHGIEEQEKLLGNTRQECIVVTEEDFDRKRILPIKPPKDFDFSYPVIVVPTGTDAAAKPVRKISPWMMPLAPTRAEPQGVAAPAQGPPPITKASGYQPKKCPYCPSDVPSNGAAQFSHLKKHVNELVARKILTAEQAAAIRSTKLSDEMQKVFSEAYKTEPVSQ